MLFAFESLFTEMEDLPNGQAENATPDKVDENIEKIASLFPNVVTEVIKGYREDGSAIVNAR